MFHLGLDVGGTKCRYAWWPEGVLPGGIAAGVQPAVQGVAAAVRGLVDVFAVARRQADVAGAVAALAGAGDPVVSGAIRDGLRAAGVGFPVAVVGDVLAAAAAALRGGPGVLLWAGTGSFAVARDVRGELHRVGGRGYLLGDQGSGYDLVRRAAAAVVMAIDGLGPATRLTEALTRAFAAPSPQRLGAALQGQVTGAVAAQLGLVLEAAAAGDTVAADVLGQGADALALLANAAARAAGLDLRSHPVALGGGVLTGVPDYRELVTARLAAFDAKAGDLLGEDAAARGAAWLAFAAGAGDPVAAQWVQRVTL